MRPSLTNLPKRTADRARAAAAGSPVPAGQEPSPPDAATRPTAGSRAAMRRRVRRLRRVRDVLLRELGALVVEMRRLRRDNPELLARKASEVRAIDDELSGLRMALGERQTVEQVVQAGVAGSCLRCGTLTATDDRYCPNCGRAVSEAGVVAEPPAEQVDAAAAPPAGHGGGAPAVAATPAQRSDGSTAPPAHQAEGPAAMPVQRDDGAAAPAASPNSADPASPPPPPPPAPELTTAARPQP